MYSNGLEYIVNGSYLNTSYSKISYFSKDVGDNYGFDRTTFPIVQSQYQINHSANSHFKYNESHPNYSTSYILPHSFAPEIFLSPSRPKTRFVDDGIEIMRFVNEAFELMTGKKLPENILINILPFGEFKALHSIFGSWSNGILGFSVNGNKKIFVRENHLDELLLVIGHEIGHVLTETLPNKHDEEAKAFAFSIEWANTIRKHDIAGLGINIREEIDFKPARNGLHDVAFAFVDLMVKKGRKAMELHSDLAKRYVSVFGKVY